MVKYQYHTQKFQCVCVKQYAGVAVTAVGIRDNSVQYAHPSESLPTANTNKKGQQFWDGVSLHRRLNWLLPAL